MVGRGYPSPWPRNKVDSSKRVREDEEAGRREGKKTRLTAKRRLMTESRSSESFSSIVFCCVLAAFLTG